MTYLPSLRKFSTRRGQFSLSVRAITLALGMATCSVALCFGAVSSHAAKAKTEKTPLVPALKKQIADYRQSSFEPLIQQIESQYGTESVLPLVEIAKNRAFQERHRYIALMAAAKIGGTASSKWLSSLLSDRSWVVRSGTLRALRSTDDVEIASKSLDLLKDKALVVRLEAVDTVAHLKPKGWEQALLRVMDRPENYVRGRALWVPNRALKALKQCDDLKTVKTAIVPKLKPLLGRSQDPELLDETIATLEAVTHSATPKNLSRTERIEYWKKYSAQGERH